MQKEKLFGFGLGLICVKTEANVGLNVVRSNAVNLVSNPSKKTNIRLN